MQHRAASKRPLQKPIPMLRSYWTAAWRHLRTNRASTVINISGLAIGMATALLIGLWITDESSFDHRQLPVAKGCAHESGKKSADSVT